MSFVSIGDEVTHLKTRLSTAEQSLRRTAQVLEQLAAEVRAYDKRLESRHGHTAELPHHLSEHCNDDLDYSRYCAACRLPPAVSLVVDTSVSV